MATSTLFRPAARAGAAAFRSAGPRGLAGVASARFITKVTLPDLPCKCGWMGYILSTSCTFKLSTLFTSFYYTQWKRRVAQMLLIFYPDTIGQPSLT